MLQLEWWGLALVILATIIVYTLILLLAYRGIMEGQKGKFLFNIPIAPFSIKSRIYSISEQLGVDESDVKYIGDNIFTVNDMRLTVEGFFGVVVYEVDSGNNRVGAVDTTLINYNLPNIRTASGELEELNRKNNNN